MERAKQQTARTSMILTPKPRRMKWSIGLFAFWLLKSFTLKSLTLPEP